MISKTVREWLSTLSTVVLVVCALVMTGLVARREWGASGIPLETSFYPDWEKLTERGHRIGSDSAPVQIELFSDYQCPYCRSLAPTIEQILAKYPVDVAVTYRHFLLEEIHPQARPAAAAAECAAEQGWFAGMHRVMFDSTAALGKRSWEELAAIAGVPDRLLFKSCMLEPRHSDAIAQDLAAALDVGLSGVPALIINGVVMTGAEPFDVVDGLVQDARGKPNRGWFFGSR